MRLYLCEKPTAARALADALGPHKRVSPFRDFSFSGHIQGDGWIIHWLGGHFYQLSEPGDHNEQYARWRLSDLPIIIRNHYWKPLVTKPGDKGLSSDQISQHTEYIKSFYANVSEVVLATDAGQEGQLLGQVFLQETGWTGPTFRLWAGSWDTEGLHAALANLRPNSEYQGLFDAGEARSIADQLIGFNFTRLFSMLAQRAGYDIKGAAGRVRSVALAIVVDSDLRHESHKATTYHVVEVTLMAGDNVIKAELELPPSLLADGKHCTDIAALESYLEGLRGLRSIEVASVKTKEERRHPPLPFDQNALGQFAATHFSLMPDKTLSIAQALYERKYLSYPRTEETMFENSDLTNAGLTIEMLAGLSDELAQAAQHVDLDNPAPVFDSSKIEEHSAINVRPLKPEYDKLSVDERNIYSAIAKRFMAQFAGPFVQQHTTAQLAVGQYRLTISGAATVRKGWSALEPVEIKDPLPPLKEGDSLVISDLEVVERKTKAPPRMTVAAFLAALKDCTRFLSEAVRNKIGKGQLGTAATQPTYLGQLEASKDVYVQDNRYVISTKKGRNIKGLTPQILNSPDMTSLWELQFKAIRKGTQSKEAFLDSVYNWVEQQILAAKNLKFKPHPLMEPCRACGCALIRRESRKSNRFFYVCSGDDCETIVPDHDGRPMRPLLEDGTPCPRCGAPMETRLARKRLPKTINKNSRPAVPAPKDRRYLACSANCDRPIEAQNNVTKE